MRTGWHGVQWVVAVAVAVGLGACGGDDDDGAAAPPADETSSTTAAATDDGEASGSSADIVIEGSTFTVAGPVPAERAVTIENLDPYEHTVTADDGGAFDVPTGASRGTELAPLGPGTYDFHCEIHPAMQATLVVE